MWTRRDNCSYEEALQERVEEGDDGRAVRAALALGDLLVAMYGGPPPLPAMLLWQCVATVGCRVCGSVCVGTEVVAAEFDVVPQWAFGCRLLDALCRGDPAAAEACDLQAMPRDVLAAVPHAVAHYADGSERDDVRALVVHRAKQADSAYVDGHSNQPQGDDDSPWCTCSVGVQQLLRFAHEDGDPLCVAAAGGAGKRLLQALQPSDPEQAPALRRCAIASAAASDAVATMATLIDGDAKQVGLAVLVSVHFGAVRCLEMLVTDFGAPAVAAAATALVERDPTHVMLQFPRDRRFGFSIDFGELVWPQVLCALPAMPQVGPTLRFLKRCGATKLSAEQAVQLVEACNQLLLDECNGRLGHGRPEHAAAATPPAPWEKRLADYDVPGALAATLDVLGWEGDLAAAAEQVEGAADTRRCGLLAVLYDRGVRPTAAHVACACANADAARVVHILVKAAPDGVDFSGADKDAPDCLLALVKAAAANDEYECELGLPSSADPTTWAAAVAALIAAGAAPTSPSARTALGRAVQMTSPAVAEVLLDAGTPIDAPDGDDYPLHHAVGVPANVAMLLRRGAAVDARSARGFTALAVACSFTGACNSAQKRRSVDARSIGALLDYGATMDNVDGHGTGVVAFFLRSERLHEVDDDIVEDVLLRMHRARGVGGVSWLLIAASRALCAVAVRVVAGTLDATQLAEVGATALLAACGCTRSVYERLVHATVKTLLDVVPPSAVHATDDRGCTPLHLLLDEASGYCDPSEAVGELLRRGADANAENAAGLTALEVHLSDVDRHGRSRGDLALGCVEVLLQHGARCRSPLALHAIVSDYNECNDGRIAAVATQLIDRGVPVDERGEDGWSAEDHAQQRRLHLTRTVLASAMGGQPTHHTTPAPCSASSGRGSREHSAAGDGASSGHVSIAPRRRARPTFSSTSSSDDQADGIAAVPGRRHRRERPT